MKPRDPIAIKNIFDDIASQYDFLNDLLSLGLHRVWKRELIVLLNPLSGEKWIDLCCGTGDVTMLLANYVGESGKVIGIDSAEKPLRVAESRSSEKTYNTIQWLKRDALQTALPSDEFDGIVMAYGLRNVIDIKQAFEEVHRLLKPGSRVGFLDFRSFNSISIFSRFQTFYLRNIVVPISSLFGLGSQYSYIENSLKSFPSESDQKKLALSVGFKSAMFKTLFFGQMGILILKN